MSENTQPGNVAETGAAVDTPAASAAAGAEPSGKPTGERTFSQAELDRIVDERLQRERKKFSDYDAIKTELADLKASNALRDMRAQVAREKQVPAELLSGDTKESCESQADALLAFAAARTGGSYPAVKDAGETGSVGGGSTRERFAEWASHAL